MSIKIIKGHCLIGVAAVSVLFNFFTPFFTLVCTMTDHLTEWARARESASGYALLGDDYFRLLDTTRQSLIVGTILHIFLSVILLGAFVFCVVKIRNKAWFQITAVGVGAALSLMYTIFGLCGASGARAAGHNLYFVTTYAYIPLIISCVLGVAYFAVYNYLDKDFTLVLNNKERE